SANPRTALPRSDLGDLLAWLPLGKRPCGGVRDAPHYAAGRDPGLRSHGIASGEGGSITASQDAATAIRTCPDQAWARLVDRQVARRRRPACRPGYAQLQIGRAHV